METRKANSIAFGLFSKWQRDFCGCSKIPENRYYEEFELFKKECLKLHNVIGVYTVLTDKNALKMASICSSVRFVEPYRMLMQLQHTTKSY